MPKKIGTTPELQYHAAWSNECIEFWFILHFAYYTSNNHRSQYVKFLNDKFRELGIGKYQKNMKDIFHILMEKGNPKLAIRYAKRIIDENKGKTPTDTAPGTKVYELVRDSRTKQYQCRKKYCNISNRVLCWQKTYCRDTLATVYLTSIGNDAPVFALCNS